MPKPSAYLGGQKRELQGQGLDQAPASLNPLTLSLLLAVSLSPVWGLLLTGSSYSAATVGKIRNEK